MSGDGSFEGVDAGRALKTILGGEDAPDDDEIQTREQVRQRLAKLPRIQDIHVRDGEDGFYWQGKRLSLDYGGTADVAARAVLDFLEAHPEHSDAPCESEFAPDAWADFDGSAEKMPKPTKLGLYDLMRGTDYDLGKLGLTGFMWGFAYNTARRLRYEEGAPNPALMEI